MGEIRNYGRNTETKRNLVYALRQSKVFFFFFLVSFCLLRSFLLSNCQRSFRAYIPMHHFEKKVNAKRSSCGLTYLGENAHGRKVDIEDILASFRSSVPQGLQYTKDRSMGHGFGGRIIWRGICIIVEAFY